MSAPAGPGAGPGPGPRAGVVAPSRHDRVVRWASEVAGGPGGTRVGAGRHGRWWSVPALVLASSVSVALGVVQRQHCREQGWTSPGQFVHACYSDVPVLVGSGGLLDGPSWSTPLAEPPPVVAALGVLGWLAPGADDAARLRWAFDAAAVVSALALVVVVVAVAALAGRRRWDAALVALSPVVVLAGLVHLELVAAALAAAGLWAWSRRAPTAAGVLLGLATAWRPALAVVLVALLLVAEARGRGPLGVRTAVVAALAWCAVQVPVAALAWDAWTAPWSAWWGASPSYGSPWMLPTLAGSPLPQAVVAGLVVGSTALVVVGVALWVARSSAPPRLPAVALVLLVGCLLVQPTLPLQASVLVVPLAALAVPRWSTHLAWWAAEAFAFVVTWQHLLLPTVPDRAAPAWLYAVALALRAAALGWLAWSAVRDSRDPALDPVRRGPATAAPDGGPCDDPSLPPVDGVTRGRHAPVP